MNSYRVLISVFLILAFCVSAVAEDWVADIHSLTDEPLPETTTLLFNPMTVSETEHTFSHHMVSASGDLMEITVTYALTDADLTDEQWSSVDEWTQQQITSAVQNSDADSAAFAKTVADSINTTRAAQSADATGMIPLWADESVILTSVSATYPYYPSLTEGDSSADVREFQEKLILLGYLDDEADGYYGEITTEAVKELERYICELEQDAIDKHPETEEETEAQTTSSVFGEMPQTADEIREDYVAEPDIFPATEVDGNVEGELYAYFMSEGFHITRRDLKLDDNGEDVKRLQTRLKALGYLAGEPDGTYGEDTERAVRIFQYYNNLDQDGEADMSLQYLIFSENATRPDNPILSIGSTGNEVSVLQKRLRILGFSTLSVDGDYGESTGVAVERLQKYMLEIETEQLQALHPGEDVSDKTTIVVNGVADPLLLDNFYDDSFPAIPEAMKNGSTGRDVERLQRRLTCLGYNYDSVDGEYGDGTTSAVSNFQSQNGLEVDGVAGTLTLQTLFNENAKKAQKPYEIYVSIDDQRVYVYALDRNGEYTDLVQEFKCSTGKNSTPTPKGTYQSTTGPSSSEWHKFTDYNCWAKYCFYICGDIMFHSVLFNSNKDSHPTRSSVNNLGHKASHGCVRLAVEDAYWIWKHCPKNTKVVIY